MEELDIIELLQVPKEHTNVNLAKNQAPAPPHTTKWEPTRKDKRRQKRQLTNNISEHDTLPNGQIVAATP